MTTAADWYIPITVEDLADAGVLAAILEGRRPGDHLLVACSALAWRLYREILQARDEVPAGGSDEADPAPASYTPRIRIRLAPAAPPPFGPLPRPCHHRGPCGCPTLADL